VLVGSVNRLVGLARMGNEKVTKAWSRPGNPDSSRARNHRTRRPAGFTDAHPPRPAGEPLRAGTWGGRRWPESLVRDCGVGWARQWGSCLLGREWVPQARPLWCE